MTRGSRRIVFLFSAMALAVVFGMAYSHFPPIGYVQSNYGDLVNSITVPELHITDAVSAVNFNIRGFDTLGEEFILFASVAGVLLLMRRQKDEKAGDHEDKVKQRIVPPASDAVRVMALLLLRQPFSSAFTLSRMDRSRQVEDFRAASFCRLLCCSCTWARITLASAGPPRNA